MFSFFSAWWQRGLVVTAAAALILGVSAYRTRPTGSDSPLFFAVEGASLGPGETIQAGTDAPAELVFSDESQVRLGPDTKASVLSLDAHGVRIALAHGELHASIQHREGASWRFDAGLFSVRVKGTTFHLSYDAGQERLSLQMLSGQVEVRGPSADRILTLGAGESIELFAGVAPRALPAPAPALAPAPAPGVDEPLPPTAEIALPRDEAPTVTRNGPNRVRHRVHGEARVDSEPGSGASDRWAQLIARGDFAAVLAEADRRGLNTILAKASPAELTSLADAARYTRRYDLARQVLLAVRARFSETNQASNAAFFLGRLAELPPSSSGAALTWYETYLDEAVHGSYAGEALGREMSLLVGTDRGRARRTAQVYLERFPQGSQAELARSLSRTASE
jgi:FecR protein